MATLKIVSWNLRTFGDPIPPDVVLRQIAEILITHMQADIVCLQEIQAGVTTSGTIGSTVSPEITGALDALLAKLRALDPAGAWVYRLSGLNNSSRSKSMRDAYAYFFKTTPAASPHAHSDAPAQLAELQSPSILRVESGGQFPGRRPGLATFEVTASANAPPVPFNLISWHAATPCNTIGKAKNGSSSGRALMALAKLRDIGGDLRKDISGGHGITVLERVNPLPDIDTIFLGDCNYNMAASRADIVYENLTTHYQPCVSTFDHVVTTTYSADPTKPLTGSSSYDNIFVLRAHDSFAPALQFANQSGAFDFIRFQAEQLGGAAEIKYFATEAAWYVCYIDQYKRQHAEYGISDHFPVWAEFTIGAGSTASRNIHATSGADNNCLFHAVFGALDDNGIYVDPQAAAHRTTFANQLEASFAPTQFDTIRANVLSVMIEQYQDMPAWLAVAQNLLSNPLLDPTTVPEWPAMVAQYLAPIRSGRMLFVHEAEILAQQQSVTLNLWRADGGNYQMLPLNPGQAQSRDIYHCALHFFRYTPT
ncbi:hypothetical protein FGG78_07755 [Thioclava sp. BHET1]|nr:hypothetical protein FGG78_07755 [Thioclava sp. BHET1]